MDNVKMPYLPEETLRTQRVEIYLNDLKERLKELRLQHDEVIQNSVDIIKEIDEVSSSLLLPQNSVGQHDNITKIKKLIQEFETAKESNSAKMPVTIENKVDIRKILQNFEQLNESHVLKDSLVLFRRAKESFEKIDTFFGKLSQNTNSSTTIEANINKTIAVDSIAGKVSVGSGEGGGGCGVVNNLRNKIIMFSGGNDKDASSHYASCCSSIMSIDIFHSTEDLDNRNKGGPSTTNSLENGYDGDNDDSEYDLFAMKKKKSKCIPPNV